MFFLLFSAKQRQLEAAKIILCASTHLPSSKTRVTWGKSFLLLVQKYIFPVILENRQPNRMSSHIALVAWWSVWDSKPPRKWLILYFCALLYTYPEWCALWKILWIFNVCIGKAFIQCMHWFPLKSFIVELTYRRPFSSVEKLMNLQEGGFGLIFVTNSSMSALLGP